MEGKQTIWNVENPFKDRVLAFTGDSITYGFTPGTDGRQLDNPWPKQVGEKLGFKKIINYGVNSGSVMCGDDIGMWTGPMVLLDTYSEYADDIDLLGFMIGINDCARGYPLGTWGDKDRTTFYGAFYMLCKGLLTKYKPRKQKIFMILYPVYAGRENWEEFRVAMKKTVHHFSIPYIDLSEEMGISIYSDTECIYWIGNYEDPTTRDCHPTQLCADVIADCVANYIRSHFSE